MDTKSLSGKYHVVTEPSPGVCLLVMNRLPVNAFNDDMWLELQHILQRVSRDASVRVVVYASSLDKLYTAGLDLTDSTLTAGGDLDPARKAIGLHRHVIDFQAAISSLANCTQPVIAALNGICMGLAIDIASSCDIRLASSDAVFSIAEVNVGLAADIGTLQRFPKIIGNDSLARELALTARKFGAGEAKEIGFVSYVVQGGRKEVIAAAVDLAKVIAEKSPIAVMSTKHLLNHARDHTVQEGLDYTAAWNMSMLQSSDTVDAMKAALSKQKAKFEPLLPFPKKRDSKL